jgi:hypothetical protein
MANRIKGIDPIYFWGITFNTEERKYLRQLARSRHPFYRDLCRDYLDAGKEKKRNWKLILELIGALAADRNENVSGQSLILVERFSQELSPEKAWPIVLRLCSSPDSDFRSYAAIVLLEHSVDVHFDFYFPLIKKEVEGGNRNLMDALSYCYFTHYTQDQVQHFDELFSQHLNKERLAEWKNNLPYYLGIRKRRKGRKPDCKWHQPVPGVDRLLGREPIAFWQHTVELNRIEKEYLRRLADSPSYEDKRLCLGFIEKLMDEKNGSTIARLLDTLLSDKDPEISGSAILLLVPFHMCGFREEAWKLIVKYGSSPNQITRELIALGPLSDRLHGFRKAFPKVAKEVKKRNELFLDTLTRCRLFAFYETELNALEALITSRLKGHSLRRWRARLKLFRSCQHEGDGSERHKRLHEFLHGPQEN